MSTETRTTTFLPDDFTIGSRYWDRWQRAQELGSDVAMRLAQLVPGARGLVLLFAAGHRRTPPKGILRRQAQSLSTKCLLLSSSKGELDIRPEPVCCRRMRTPRREPE